MNAGPERIHRLAAERAPALVGNRHARHHWHTFAPIRKIFLDGVQRGLQIQRVKRGLGQQHIYPTLY